METSLQWNDYLNFSNEDAIPTSTLKYDNNFELLWIGYASGRISSYSAISDNTRCYSSFMGHKSQVLNISTLPNQVVSFADSSIAIHSTGGSLLHRFARQDESSEAFHHTCGFVYQQSGGLLRSQADYNVFVGHDNECALVYDLNTSEVIVTYDVMYPTICAQPSVTFLAVGGSDGAIRLLDPSMRSCDVLHRLDAHSGTVNSLSFHSNGMSLVSCGYNARPINPYDPKSPLNYHVDPVVKLFDIRMMRVVSSVGLSIPPPIFVSYFQSPPLKPNSSAYSQDVSSMSVLALSSNGYMQMWSPEDNTVAVDYFMSPLNHEQEEAVTCCDVSSSGCLIATGTTFGATLQNAINVEVDSDFIVNSISSPLYFPSNPVKAELALTVETPILASAYVLSSIPTDEEYSSFLSSNDSNSDLITQSLRVSTRRKICPALLSQAHLQDFIGSIHNKNGLLPNSYFSKDLQGKVYDICDPRSKFSSVPPQGQAADRWDSRTEGTKGDWGFSHASSGQVTKAVGDGGLSSSSAANTISVSNQTHFNVPHMYQKISSRTSVKSLQQFHYSSFNRTKFVGLENVSPLSWMNPVLQFLFSVPEVRQMALKAQESPFHYSRPNTLLCELGFLFDVMLLLGLNEADVPAFATNFVVAFQQSSEAAAVGLLQKSTVSDIATAAPSSSSSSEAKTATTSNLHDGKKVQSLVQIFIRFILQIFRTEHEQEHKLASSYSNSHQQGGGHNTYSNKNNNNNNSSGSPGKQSRGDAIEHVFGHTITTFNTFLTSNTVEKGSNVQACTVDMIYPVSPPTRKRIAGSTANTAPGRPAPSFANVLWCSIDKESYMRGWCISSDSYEPLKQSRKVLPHTLPNMLLLLCGDTLAQSLNKDSNCPDSWTPQSLWHTELSPGKSWLPHIVEIFQGKDGRHYVSQLVHVDTSETEDVVDAEEWLVYDGKTEFKASGSASMVCEEGEGSITPCCVLYSLHAVISGIMTSEESAHSILHLRTSLDENGDSLQDKWTVFNDFNVSPCDPKEVTHFAPYRVPCAVVFSIDKNSPWPDYTLESSLRSTQRISISPNVLRLPSLSPHACVMATKIVVNGGVKQPHLVAFDAEFVSTEVARTEVDATGERTTHHSGRQVLARVTMLDGSSVKEYIAQNLAADKSLSFPVLADDYVLPTEKVQDYVTRFSGISEDDLNPSLSRHAIVTPRTAYLKLRYYLDGGCVFVGHGLQKDFETANIYVPKEQIIDTVELWRLPHQRMIALRFLAHYLLGMDIQDDVHDSSEDAKTALLLYQHYEIVRANGNEHLQTVLQDLYNYGTRTNWTIGFDDIQKSSTHTSLSASFGFDSRHGHRHGHGHGHGQHHSSHEPHQQGQGYGRGGGRHAPQPRHLHHHPDSRGGVDGFSDQLAYGTPAHFQPPASSYGAPRANRSIYPRTQHASPFTGGGHAPSLYAATPAIPHVHSAHNAPRGYPRAPVQSYPVNGAGGRYRGQAPEYYPPQYGK